MRDERSNRAFALAEQGNFADAAKLYRDHVDLLPTDHWATPMVFGEFGWALTKLGQLEDAGRQYARALELEEAQANGEFNNCVAVARYFLAENLLARAEPQHALDIVAPILSRELKGSMERIARTVEADALGRLGRTAEAKSAAARALELASDNDMREHLRKRLGGLLEP